MRMRELRRKEVINITDGGRLGFVGDVDFRLPDGQAAALIIYGPARFFGLFGREPDLIIPWNQIKCIGEDTVLVEIVSCPAPPRRRPSFAGALH